MIPKPNADFSIKPKGLNIFIKNLIPIANSNGFRFDRKKEKTKPKDFAM
jgi:hypothetical protein